MSPPIETIDAYASAAGGLAYSNVAVAAAYPHSNFASSTYDFYAQSPDFVTQAPSQQLVYQQQPAAAAAFQLPSTLYKPTASLDDGGYFYPAVYSIYVRCRARALAFRRSAAQRAIGACSRMSMSQAGANISTTPPLRNRRRHRRRQCRLLRVCRSSRQPPSRTRRLSPATSSTFRAPPLPPTRSAINSRKRRCDRLHPTAAAATPRRSPIVSKIVLAAFFRSSARRPSSSCK